jgi:hypothetical protein
VGSNHFDGHDALLPLARDREVNAMTLNKSRYSFVDVFHQRDRNRLEATSHGGVGPKTWAILRAARALASGQSLLLVKDRAIAAMLRILPHFALNCRCKLLICCVFS